MSAAIRQTSPKGRSRSMYGSSAIFMSGLLPSGRADAVAEDRAARADPSDHPLPDGRLGDGRRRLQPADDAVDNGQDGGRVGGHEERPVDDLDVDRRG